jgi:hypothetical protein
MRLRTIAAIASQDWAQEFRGRRGWILPVLAALLLTPLAAAPLRGDSPPARPVSLALEGDPGPLQGLPSPQAGDVLVTARVRAEGGRWVLTADEVPEAVRARLDGPAPTAQVRAVSVDLNPAVPGRPLVLTLLAASLLTGAVSESLPGERSRKTLEALLTAAVTRWEIVLGKWAAWASLGTAFALLSSGIAVVAGQIPLGPWMLAVPAVPMGTVALGLYLVRRARDVVGGATVALRVLPAALSILGLIAWVLGLVSPWLGAAVPLGGALVAAGGTWGIGPTALAAGLTIASSAIALAATTRGLESPEAAGERAGTPVGTLVWAALGWWGALLGGVAWWPAGNPALSQGLPAWVSLGAAASVLAAVWVIARAGEVSAPVPIPAWQTRHFGGAVLAALATAGALIFAPTLVPANDGWAALALARADLGLRAEGWLLPLAMVAAVAQEALLRDFVQRRWGALWALGIGVTLFSPHDPVAGLVIGVSAALLTAWTGRWWLAAAARVAGLAGWAAVAAWVG